MKGVLELAKTKQEAAQLMTPVGKNITMRIKQKRHPTQQRDFQIPTKS